MLQSLQCSGLLHSLENNTSYQYLLCKFTYLYWVYLATYTVYTYLYYVYLYCIYLTLQCIPISAVYPISSVNTYLYCVYLSLLCIPISTLYTYLYCVHHLRQVLPPEDANRLHVLVCHVFPDNL